MMMMLVMIIVDKRFHLQDIVLASWIYITKNIYPGDTIFVIAMSMMDDVTQAVGIMGHVYHIYDSSFAHLRS